MNIGQRTVVAAVAVLLGLSGQALAGIINVPGDPPASPAGSGKAGHGLPQTSVPDPWPRRAG